MSLVIRGILLGLSVTAPIGPTNVEVIRRGVREGWQASAAFCLGAMVALVLYLTLVVFGLAYLTESAPLNTALQILGIIVLAYLVHNSIKDFIYGQGVELNGDVSARAHFLPGVALTISNPAVLLFWTGIIGADLSARSASPEDGLLLSLGILSGVALFFTILTTLIHFGKGFLQQRYLRYVSLLAGLVQVFFLARFAFSLVDQLRANWHISCILIR
jgi:threonine/homoserine/homoserine lactone efflux protein